jgi:hypothetical protein
VEALDEAEELRPSRYGRYASLVCIPI